VHFHIGLVEFLIFAGYYFLLKAVILFINLEARRNHWHVPGGVAGLLS
jgi:hypothetical protein